MRYFMDSEFIDDGKTIDLISIGIVCEDGREYYAQSTECYVGHASDWVKEHVIPHLSLCPHMNRGSGDILAQIQNQQSGHGFFGGRCYKAGLTRHEEDCPWRTRRELKDDIRMFFNPSDGFELWGWCAGYDFVAFCQLFGTMMDLPQGWPHYIRDVQYLLDEFGMTDEQLAIAVPQSGTTHNALDDARYIQEIWKAVNIYARPPRWTQNGPVAIQGSVQGTMIITGDNNAVLRSNDHGKQSSRLCESRGRYREEARHLSTGSGRYPCEQYSQGISCSKA